MVSEVGIRGSILGDYSDPESMATNIQGKPGAFRLALMLDMTMSCSDVFISFLLGGILIASGANSLLSMIAMSFRLMQQAVLATNLLHMFAASLLLDPTLPFAPIVDELWATDSAGTSTSESLGYLFLLLHKYGYLLALIFFGISLFLFGYVVLVWGVFPKWLGVALALAGIGYVMDSSLFFLMDGYNGETTNILMLPALVAEFGLAGLLLFRQPTLSLKRSS